MFKGNASVSFETAKPKKEVFEFIEEALNNVGRTEVSDRCSIRINSSKMEGLFNEASIEGSVRVKENKYTIEIDYESKPKIITWALFCFGLIGGVAGLFFTNQAKDEMGRKIDRALGDVKAEFN